MKVTFRSVLKHHFVRRFQFTFWRVKYVSNLWILWVEKTYQGSHMLTKIPKILLLLTLFWRTELPDYHKMTRSSHRRCSIKKVFLKISQNSQKNACAGFSFLIKLQIWELQLYSKRDSGTGVSLWILWNFEEHLFYRTPHENNFSKVKS